MQIVLEVSHLKKTFRLSKKQQKIERTDKAVKVAVNDLSFNVYRGEIYGLLGPNGAGKTTTLRILSTLIQADEGDAKIDGVSVRQNPDGVRKKIGFLTSELKLEDFFTPDYLYDYFSELHGVEKSVAASRKQKLFSKFGIDKFAAVRVGDLSTGMKQKVSLVISLVHDPEFIIFDEPTNGLDVVAARTVTDFLQLLRSEGKTVVLSTHIFSLVEKLCDRVGIIMDGKMIADAPVAELTKEKSMEEVFFELYENNGEGKHA